MTKTKKAATPKETAAQKITPPVHTEGIAHVSLPKTQEELNKNKLTFNANATVKVLAHYRAGQNPIVILNRELSHYSVAINGIPIIINEKQYNALFGTEEK